MQYLKEMPNGTRVIVSENEWRADKIDRTYHQIIAAGTIIVYKLAKRMGTTFEKPLVFGGRKRGSNAFWNGA